MLAFLAAFDLAQTRGQSRPTTRVCRRQRAVAQIILHGLNDLKKFAAGNKPDEFFATLFRLLQEQLGERLDCPRPAITENVIDEHPGFARRAGGHARWLARTIPALQPGALRARARHQRIEFRRRQIRKVVVELQELQVMKTRSAQIVFRFQLCLAALLLAGTWFSGFAGVRFRRKIFAADAAGDFSAANKFYAEGKFSAAATAYERILNSGGHSPNLLFNYGNAEFKCGNLGQAIAAFRRAELLAPRDSEIRANLDFVRNQVQGSTVRESRWQNWPGQFTLNEWTLLTAVAFWLTLFCSPRARSGRRSSRVEKRRPPFSSG